MAELTFEPESHVYRIDGRVVPSVTQIIQRVMPYEGPRDEWAMQRGTAMHHGCALDDMGKLDWDSVAPEISNRILAWRKFRRDWNAALVRMEQPLGSARYQFAGTPDRVFEHNGGYWLCDLKSNIVPQSIVQIGFYALLIEDCTPLKIDSAVIVELHDDESFKCEWIKSPDLLRAKRVAMACLTCHGFMAGHQLGERNVNSSR